MLRILIYSIPLLVAISCTHAPKNETIPIEELTPSPAWKPNPEYVNQLLKAEQERKDRRNRLRVVLYDTETGKYYVTKPKKKLTAKDIKKMNTIYKNDRFKAINDEVRKQLHGE